ncbi:hypothetical protein QQZ08_008262 [Neonectria magnoliae]|uniref:Protein kinase domain-containing protein n=1 Tax=Neonectria magnoliae TaxID=2732573 RepID=A0ABR1HWB3_9HYPO
MSDHAGLPELVRDTKLHRTKILTDQVYHELYEAEDGSRPMRRWEGWKNERIIGRGGFGEVWLQRCVSRANKLRAVKAIRKPKVMNANTCRELEAMAKFSQRRFSPSFVGFTGWYADDRVLYIAMEYLPLGDLGSYMVEHSPMAEADVCEVTFQVLEGLQMMHQEEFAHRDIKPENILIKGKPPGSKWWVVLSDFGIAKRVTPLQKRTSDNGTREYMAPELRTKEPGPADHRAIDMWCLGETVFRMLMGTAAFPWDSNSPKHLVNQGVFPLKRLQKYGVNDHAVEFIQRCLKLTRSERIESSQALEHPWFKEQKNGRLLFLPTCPSFEQLQQADKPRYYPIQDGMGNKRDPWDTAESINCTARPPVTDTESPPELPTETPVDMPQIIHDPNEYLYIPRKLGQDGASEAIPTEAWYINEEGQACWSPYFYNAQVNDTPPPPLLHPPPQPAEFATQPWFNLDNTIGQDFGPDWNKPRFHIEPQFYIQLLPYILHMQPRPIYILSPTCISSSMYNRGFMYNSGSGCSLGFT